jgi:hypothetical protein
VPFRASRISSHGHRAFIGGFARGDDVPGPAEVLAASRYRVVEDLLGREVAGLPYPDDIIAPVQAVEGVVQFGDTSASRFVSYASKPTASEKPKSSR